MKRLLKELSVPINCRHPFILWCSDSIPSIPNIPTESIEDRSKGDIFTKGLALIQITWLAVSLVTRAVRQLAVSQLEIATAAFAACTFITYFFNRNKPQDLRGFTLEVSNTKFSGTVAQKLSKYQLDGMIEHLVHSKLKSYQTKNYHEWALRVPNDSFEVSPRFIQPVAIILATSTVSQIFGCCMWLFQ